MANIWTVKTNHELGVDAERVSTTIALPLNTTNFTISSVKVISGSLPGGLRIAVSYTHLTLPTKA